MNSDFKKANISNNMKYILSAYPFRFLGHPMRRKCETKTMQCSSVCLLVEQPTTKKRRKIQLNLEILLHLKI